MLYRPVTGSSPRVSLREAVLRGVAPDGALYLPESFPKIPRAFFNNIAGMSAREIGFVVANLIFGSDIEAEQLKEIVDKTITYDIPFNETTPGNFELDLTQGPSRNYNDIGARFMAHLIDLLVDKEERFNVLVASSRNVANAVADAFSSNAQCTTYAVFPSASLSATRRNELMSYANVVPVEIGGSFNECQHIVKKVLLDHELQDSALTLSANSNNVAILFPRVVYFFYAYSRLAALNLPLDNVAIATPTENLGNITAAIIANLMGLPVGRFIAILTSAGEEADKDNESRLTALLANRDEKPTVITSEECGHIDNEIRITLKTDRPEPSSLPDSRNKSNNKVPRHKCMRFAPTSTALKNLILQNNRLNS